MTPVRDNKGRFIKGKPGGPGRPPRATEQEYRDTIKEVIPLDRFIRQLEKLAARADRGDSRAFDKICDLLGLHVVKSEVTGKDGGPLEFKDLNYDERIKRAFAILEAARNRTNNNPAERYSLVSTPSE